MILAKNTVIILVIWKKSTGFLYFVGNFVLIFVSRQENETKKLLVLNPPKCNIFKKDVFLKIFFFYQIYIIA